MLVGHFVDVHILRGPDAGVGDEISRRPKCLRASGNEGAARIGGVRVLATGDSLTRHIFG